MADIEILHYLVGINCLNKKFNYINKLNIFKLLIIIIIIIWNAKNVFRHHNIKIYSMKNGYSFGDLQNI